MTARHDTTRQPVASPRDVPGDSLDGDVESTSTRVLIDGGPRQCQACEAHIAAGARYRCLTVRDGGGVSELAFCDGDCFPAREAGRRVGAR
jgi:hypothetical protein